MATGLTQRLLIATEDGNRLASDVFWAGVAVWDAGQRTAGEIKADLGLSTQEASDANTIYKAAYNAATNKPLFLWYAAQAAKYVSSLGVAGNPDGIAALSADWYEATVAWAGTNL